MGAAWAADFTADTQGNIYEGEWKHSQRHGVGKMIYANGDCWDGIWLDGKKRNGALRLRKSDVYLQRWEKGRLQYCHKVAYSIYNILHLHS